MASKISRSISTGVQSPENVSNTAVYLRQTSLGSQYHQSKKNFKTSQQLNEIEWNTSLPNELNQHQHQQLQLQHQQKDYDLIESNNNNLSEVSTESLCPLNQYINPSDLDTQSISAYDNIIHKKKAKTKAAVPTAETIQFWEIGGYKILLDRCDNGLKLTTDLKTMIEKRANLEKDYASSLKK